MVTSDGSAPPATRGRIHPPLWGIEMMVILTFVLYSLIAQPWTMWRHGIRITGPVVAEKESDEDNSASVTILEPGTDNRYTAGMHGTKHDIGTMATVIVHPTDRSKVWTTGTVYFALVVQGLLVAVVLAFPVAALIWRHGQRAGPAPGA